MKEAVGLLIVLMIFGAIAGSAAEWVWGRFLDSIPTAPAQRWALVWRVWALVSAALLGVALPLVGFTEVVIAGAMVLIVGLYYGFSPVAAERHAREYHAMRRAHCGKCGREVHSPFAGECPHCGWTLALPKGRRS